MKKKNIVSWFTLRYNRNLNNVIFVAFSYLCKLIPFTYVFTPVWLWNSSGNVTYITKIKNHIFWSFVTLEPYLLRIKYQQSFPFTLKIESREYQLNINYLKKYHFMIFLYIYGNHYKLPLDFLLISNKKLAPDQRLEDSNFTTLK